MVGCTSAPGTPPSRRMAGSGAASVGVPLAIAWPSGAAAGGGTSRLHSSRSSSQAWKALPPAMVRASSSGGVDSTGITGMPARASAGATVSFSTSWSRLAPKAAKCARACCSMASGTGAIQPSNSFQAERRRRTPTRSWCTCSELPARYTPSVSTSASTAALRAIWSRHSAAMAPMACGGLMSSRSLIAAAPRRPEPGDGLGAARLMVVAGGGVDLCQFVRQLRQRVAALGLAARVQHQRVALLPASGSGEDGARLARHQFEFQFGYGQFQRARAQDAGVIGQLDHAVARAHAAQQAQHVGLVAQAQLALDRRQRRRHRCRHRPTGPAPDRAAGDSFRCG